MKYQAEGDEGEDEDEDHEEEGEILKPSPVTPPTVEYDDETKTLIEGT